MYGYTYNFINTSWFLVIPNIKIVSQRGFMLLRGLVLIIKRGQMVCISKSHL